MKRVLYCLYCLLWVGYVCYGGIPKDHKKPIEPIRSLIGVSVSIKKFPFNVHPANLFFLKVTGTKSKPKTELVISNYSAGSRVYLINAEPGIYMAIGSSRIITSETKISPNMKRVTGSLSVMLFPGEIIKKSLIRVEPGQFAYMGKFVMKEDHTYEKFDGFQKINHAKLRKIIEETITSGSKSYSRGSLIKYSKPTDRFLRKAKLDFQGTGWLDILSKK